MLSKLRPIYNEFMVPFGRASIKMGFTPDAWTIFSLIAALLSGLMLAQGRFWWGFALSLVMFAGDMMDGATARARGITNKFGTVLDHVVDRYVEFIIVGGLLIGGWLSPFGAIFSSSGIVMASYVRAKAESAGGLQECVVGIAGRLEKILIIYAALIFFGLGLRIVAEYAFWFVGLISHITALQRLVYTRSRILSSQSETS